MKHLSKSKGVSAEEASEIFSEVQAEAVSLAEMVKPNFKYKPDNK